MKKAVSLIMCMIMVISLFSVSASAAEESGSSVQPRYTYILTTAIGCDNLNGTVTVAASITARPSDVESVSITLYMQRRPAGSSASWDVIGVYKGSGTYTCSTSGRKDSADNYEYRAYAIYKATTPDGDTERIYKYSGIQ